LGSNHLTGKSPLGDKIELGYKPALSSTFSRVIKPCINTQSTGRKSIVIMEIQKEGWVFWRWTCEDDLSMQELSRGN
jgi:hypothetical protein